MRLGMIALDRRSADIVCRLTSSGPECATFDTSSSAGATLAIEYDANVGMKAREVDVEGTRLRDPEYYRYGMNLAHIAEVWQRRGVVTSWFLGLAAISLSDSPDLKNFSDHLRLRHKTVDDPGRDQAGDVSRCAQRRAMRAVRFTRRCQLSQQAAVCDAIPNRRSCRGWLEARGRGL